ncbi:MAG: prepilin-type N-terminal cleavage/methylation domain-containing protein [Candidatus Omnitrophica bacterium]|nr:prepilin-type N-terminal cleavage/methylation domain-containing protein [Candidatus Omnitrophota bacterium]
MKKGLTLVELMVTVLLFTVLSSAAYIALEVGRRSMRVGGVELELQQAARKAMMEMLKELRETDAGTVTIYTYTDTQNGERHQAIAFASPRGSATAPKDSGTCGDGVTNNACFHIGSSGDPSWRSLIVYAVYETSDGRKELRRYHNFDAFTYYNSDIFPFTFNSISNTQISLKSKGGTNFAFNRNGVTNGVSPRVIAEHVVSEDADKDNVLDGVEDDGSVNVPFDNADGVLNRGADFSLTGRSLTLSLFLRKRDTSMADASRFVVSTLEGSAELRK